MKRLGTYIFITFLLLTIVGTLNVSKAHAQGIDRQTESGTIVKKQATITDADYTALQTSAKDFDFDYKTKNDSFFSWGDSYPSKEYLKILKNAYDSTKDNPQTTKRSLEVQTLNEFIIYLNDRIKSVSERRTTTTKLLNLTPTGILTNATIKALDNEKEALEVVLVMAKQKFQNAVSSVQLENGAISAEEHTKNITNASKEATAATAARVDDASKCSLLVESPVINCLDAAITWFIKNTLLQIGGFLVWLTANMFNYSIRVGVLEFSTWAPSSLYPVWIIVRQTISLVIVFVGLYLGFMYILGRDEKFKAYLPWVILFALFVNFSYPLTRTAIDISNVISLNIYTSTVGSEALGGSVNNTAGALIMDKLGLQDLAMSATQTKEGNMLSSVQSVPGALLAVIFVFYAAYILFKVTAIFIMRTAALVFITIASPLLFVDSVLPLLGEKAQHLRKIFFEQLIVGPIFMIMFALTLKFLEIFSQGPAKMAGAGFETMSKTIQGGSVDTVTTFFNILIMLIMLHIMIKVTTDVAGELGKYATNAMGRVGGFGLGVASGGAGFLARRGIGGLAAKVGNSEWVRNNKDSVLGRGVSSMSNSLANASFDLRNSSVVAGGMAKAGMGSGLLGIGMGAGAKTGFVQGREARIKKRTEVGESVGVYQENVYEDGKLIHKKGEKDMSPAAVAARERYAKNGGSLLSTEYERLEVAQRLGEGEKSRFQTRYDKILAEYKERKAEAEEKYPDTEEGKKAKEEALKKKSDFFNGQDADTRSKLAKFEAKEDAARQEKEEDRADRKEALAVARATAESNQALAKAMESARNATTPSTNTGGATPNPTVVVQPNAAAPTPTVVLQPGETLSSGGIIIPTSASPEVALKDMNQKVIFTPKNNAAPEQKTPPTVSSTGATGSPVIITA